MEGKSYTEVLIKIKDTKKIKSNMKKRVLVTGGAGFIGSHVVDVLISKGYEVLILDNLSTGKASNINEKSIFFNVDMTDFKSVEEVFDNGNIDFVIHGAAHGYYRGSFERPLYDAKLNILGSLNIIECCKKFNVKKIVYLSTYGLYGEPIYLPVDEKHPKDPLSPYGISKSVVEDYLKLYNKLYDLNFVAVRFSNVYGPRSDAVNQDVIPIFIKNISENKKSQIFGDGFQSRDFIYVEDVADAVILALEKETKNRFFNIGTGKQVFIKELYDMIRRKMGSNIDPIHVEPKKGEFRNIYSKNDLAKEDLGWDTKVGIDEGLNRTIGWHKSR